MKRFASVLLLMALLGSMPSAVSAITPRDAGFGVGPSFDVRYPPARSTYSPPAAQQAPATAEASWYTGCDAAKSVVGWGIRAVRSATVAEVKKNVGAALDIVLAMGGPITAPVGGGRK